jgi:hypothetical protein
VSREHGDERLLEEIPEVVWTEVLAHGLGN